MPDSAADSGGLDGLVPAVLDTEEVDTLDSDRWGCTARFLSADVLSSDPCLRDVGKAAEDSALVAAGDTVSILDLDAVRRGAGCRSAQPAETGRYWSARHPRV